MIQNKSVVTDYEKRYHDADRNEYAVSSGMSLTYLKIEDLFHQYRDELIRRLTRLVRCEETAADLVQETYLRLIRLIDSQRVLYPRALLFRTATNLAIDYLRRGKFERHVCDSLDAAMEVASADPSVEQALFSKQRLQILLRVIDALPPRTREAFLLHRVHDYSYPEIAIRLGISESAVEKLMMRALSHCSSALQHHDAD